MRDTLNRQAWYSLLAIELGGIVLGYWKDLPWLIITVLIVGFVAGAIKPVRLLIHKAWMGLAKIMGKISGVILLTLVYFIVLTPSGILQRLFSKNDPLKLKWKSGKMEWVDTQTTSSPAHIEKMW